MKENSIYCMDCVHKEQTASPRGGFIGVCRNYETVLRSDKHGQDVKCLRCIELKGADYL